MNGDGTLVICSKTPGHDAQLGEELVEYCELEDSSWLDILDRPGVDILLSLD